MNKSRQSVDMVLLVIVACLIGIGVVMVYSASYAVAKEKFGYSGFFIIRHMIRLGIGFIGLYIAMNIDYHKWANVDRIIMAIAFIALIFLLISGGVKSINGARRWIHIGGLSFQPSEFIKLALIIYMARSLSEKQYKLQNFMEGLLPHLAIIGAAVALVVAEPDYSTSLVITVILMGMVFVAGASIKHLLLLGGMFLPVAYFVLLGAPYRRARLMAFLDPGEHVQNIGYQAHQALIGLGAGGFIGSGLGQSRQKLFYLPEPYTDFVFSVLGEEMGFIGAVAVLVLFGFFFWRGYRIAVLAPDTYGYLLGFGITTMLATYTLFHVGVATSLLPTTGIPLPFISYGGVSLIFTMVLVGILLNISSQAKVNDSN